MGYVIASRKSDLARIQALQVAACLKEKNPKLELEHYFRPSLGDLNQSDPLWKMPEKGVFTEDFRQGLVDGSFDMVVHSWKDLPVESLMGTEIVATLPRADMRDMFLLKKSTWPQVVSNRALTVMTSSPRRMHNLEPFFKNYLPTEIASVEFHDVRGNVPTRIQKLLGAPQVDGLVLAKAAWDRLMMAPQEEFQELQEQMRKWLKDFYWMVLPLKENPNAAAQGALAVEIAEGREDLKQLLSTVHCPETWACVRAERSILKSHGGGCHQKIGVSVLRRDYGTLTFSKGVSEAGVCLDQEDLNDGQESQEPQFSEATSFPSSLEKASGWFERVPRANVSVAEGHHFVARSNAFPDGQKLELGTCVWTAGLTTWQRLASRGIWVCGSFEGLGENEPMRLEALLETPGPWWKWSHALSPMESNPNFQLMASYDLVAREESPDVASKKNFYWMSGTAFEEAIKKNPEIIAANHYCGPGNTFSFIVQRLASYKNAGPVRIKLSHAHWARETWKGHSS